MSSSSDAKNECAAAIPSSPLARLLEAMASEWTAIAEDVSRLGNTVSSRAEAHGDLAAAVELQAFDTIQQRAEGQANLLVRLACKVAGDHPFDRNCLVELLDIIPFHSVRASLEGAFDGHATQHANPQGNDEVDWF